MRRHSFVVLVVCALGAVFSASAQESASFRIERVAVASGAAPAISTSFGTLATVAEVEPVGVAGSCGGVRASSFGFWSILGRQLVPIKLDVSRNPAVAGEVDLIWSGSADLFQVYRGFIAQSLVNAGNLYAEQPNCSTSDTIATAAPIVFYIVVEKP